MQDTSIKDCSSYPDYNPPHAEIKSAKVIFSIDAYKLLFKEQKVGWHLPEISVRWVVNHFTSENEG
ncbi:hypothetical protein D3C81_1278180 [compost metagenome]